MLERKKILITGASGNLGNKIRRHLEAQDHYDLIFVDMDPRGDTSVIQADLSLYDPAWVPLFEGIDTVVHLAADPREQAPWESLESKNIDSIINVYEAAVAGQVKRVIFASSNAAMSGYENQGVAVITSALPAWPVNLYGAGKVMGERLGRSYAERHGLSVICLRIGWVRARENLPPQGLGSYWSQRMWLSNRDLCQAVEQAINVIDIRFAVLNVMSDNQGMSWDLSETRHVLGFVPLDKSVPIRTPFVKRLRACLWRIKRRLLDVISWRKSLL